MQKGKQGSKITQVKRSEQTKSEWNWISFGNYFSYYSPKQRSSNKRIRHKHTVLALNCNCEKSRDIKINIAAVHKLRQRISYRFHLTAPCQLCCLSTETKTWDKQKEETWSKCVQSIDIVHVDMNFQHFDHFLLTYVTKH